MSNEELRPVYIQGKPQRYYQEPPRYNMLHRAWLWLTDSSKRLCLATLDVLERQQEIEESSLLAFLKTFGYVFRGDPLVRVHAVLLKLRDAGLAEEVEGKWKITY